MFFLSSTHLCMVQNCWAQPTQSLSSLIGHIQLNPKASSAEILRFNPQKDQLYGIVCFPGPKEHLIKYHKWRQPKDRLRSSRDGPASRLLIISHTDVVQQSLVVRTWRGEQYWAGMKPTNMRLKLNRKIQKVCFQPRTGRCRVLYCSMAPPACLTTHFFLDHCK